MQTTTAKVTTPNGPRYIPGAVNFHGFLAQPIQVGKGEIVRYEVWTNGIDDAGEEPIYERYETEYKFFMNSTLFEENGLTKEFVTDYLKKEGNMAAMNHEQIRKTILRWGDNPNGYKVEDHEAAKQALQEEEQVRVARKEVPIVFSSSYGLRCNTRLPKEVWAIVKPFAEFIKADDGDNNGHDGDDWSPQQLRPGQGKLQYMEKQPRIGGKRAGAGRKKLNVTPVTIKLGPEELEAVQRSGNASKYLRYLIRKAAGLCLHPLAIVDTATGEMQCQTCGASSFETYGEFIIKRGDDGV